MSYNPSLAKFKTEMHKLREQIRFNFHQRMLQTANEIAENMRSAAPKDKGVLAASVRVQDNTRSDQASKRVSVKIKAGGEATQRRNSRSGQLYDYSAAIEFGTQDMPAEPFFYNTWRRYRAAWPDAARETLEQTLERNNKIVAERAGAAGRQTLGRRSGVVVGKQGK